MHVARGFTLLEVALVLCVMALLTALVSRAMPLAAERGMREESQRLVAALERARALSRASGEAVTLRLDAGRWEFRGAQTARQLPQQWLYPSTHAAAAQLILGPDPIIPPQHIELFGEAGAHVRIATDGVSPFAVEATP